MRFFITLSVFIFSAAAFAVDVAGAAKSSPLHPKIEIKCAKEEDLNKYDHGVLEAQFDTLAIQSGVVEMTLSFTKKFCQKNSAGVVDFVGAGLFESYSYDFMQNIVVDPLRFAISVYNTSTYEVYGSVALKAETGGYQASASIPLDKILSATEISSIKNEGKKVEKMIGISVNQLSDYTTESNGKTIQANQMYHLKTTLLFF